MWRGKVLVLMPMRCLCVPAFRFGILPGYKWDGVDRSNGFEKTLQTRKATKESQAEAAYKWASEDM